MKKVVLMMMSLLLIAILIGCAKPAEEVTVVEDTYTGSLEEADDLSENLEDEELDMLMEDISLEDW